MALRHWIYGGVAAFGLAGIVGGVKGCSDDFREYHYEGDLNERYVEFLEPDFWDFWNGFDTHLTITRGDKSLDCIYDSARSTLSVEEVKLTVGNNTTTYRVKSVIPDVAKIISEADKKCKKVLDEITEKQKTALNI